MATRHEPIRYEQERVFPMSVEEAWRILADTEHLNRSIGLPSVDFSPLEGASDPLVREARAKAYGVVPVRWREYPFDWVRQQRYVVRREFETGPIEWIEGGIELRPAEGGVNVNAFALFTPKNVAGRFLWRLGRTPVTGLLDFCDSYLARKAAGRADPVPVPAARAAVDQARLDRLIAELEHAPVRPELIPLLRERIVEGSDDQLTRVRPFSVAEAWSADRADVLSLFLYAARGGLFALRWELMCPNCRVPKGEISTLSDLPPEFHCDTCGISYSADVDERIELRFTVSPSVRPTSDDTYCIGGPLRMPHVVAQQFLGANEDRRVDLALDEPLLLRTVGSASKLSLVRGPAARGTNEVKLTYAGGRWVGPHSLADGDTLTIPDGAALSLRNQTGGSVLALLESLEWTRDATTVSEASLLHEFRDLFGSEVLRMGRQLEMQHVALLFSTIEGSAELYDRLGDAIAYSVIDRHFGFIGEQAEAAGGTLVRTSGDGTMCAFARVEDALEAAVGIQRGIGAWSNAEAIEPLLRLQLGLHHGPAIAATANGQIDYLGRTANLAARLCELAQGGEIVVLAETPLDAGDLSLEPFAAPLRPDGPESRLIRIVVS